MPSHLPDIHRLLPQAIEAEKGILCSALLSPKTVLPPLLRKVDASHFYSPAHELIFNGIKELWESGKPVDFIALTQLLKDRKELDRAQGAACISDLYSFIPTATNADYYTDIVREKKILRQVIETCNKYGSRAYDEQGDVKVLLDEFEGEALSIGAVTRDEDHKSIKDIIMEVVDDIEKGDQDRVLGIHTGLPFLDEHVRLAEGAMWLIGGTNSSGKTSLVLNLVNSVCINKQLPGAIFSLEMPKKMLVRNLLTIRSRVPVSKLFNKTVTPQEMDRWTKAMNDVAKAPIHIWGKEYAGMSIKEAHSHCRELKGKKGLRLAVFDYDEKFKGDSRKNRSNEEDLHYVSSTVDNMAGELSLSAILLSQLTVTKDAKGKEMKPRWRYSEGKINDAAVAIRINNRVQAGQTSGPVDIIFDKGRDFGRGMQSTVLFNGALKQFTEMPSGYQSEYRD